MKINISTEFLMEATEYTDKKAIDKAFNKFLVKCKNEEEQIHLVKCYKSLLAQLEPPPQTHSSSSIKHKKHSSKKQTPAQPPPPYQPTSKKDKRLEPIIVKPPEKPISLDDIKREEINTVNLFKGKSFDINTFNNMFESIKEKNKKPEGVKYAEDFQVYDFNEQGFSGFQPIVHYAGIIVPDTEEPNPHISHGSYQIHGDLSLSDRPTNTTGDKYSNSNVDVRQPIKNLNDYYEVKQNKIKQEMEEKRRKVQQSLHLYENQSPEQLMSMISNFNPDKLVNNLVKGPFEN
jgi:hypothetical protein